MPLPADPPVAPVEDIEVRRKQYLEVKDTIQRQLLSRINLETLATTGRAQAEGEIRNVVNGLIADSGASLSPTESEAILGDVLDEVFGLGPLEPLIRDATVSDILVNTWQHVFVERKGKLERVPGAFQDDAHLMRIIDRIVSAVGRRIDESSPMVDARLQDGSRVNAIIPPLAVDGPLLSIRRFPAERLKAKHLVEFKSITAPMIEFLSYCVSARLNCLVSGGTGSGKNTLLNVLSGYIGNTERIVTIEDAAELQLHQEHVARLETRPANVEGKGAIPQRQLVINSLRMRPDRIVIGEVRGGEALDMLQAMNTGHDRVAYNGPRKHPPRRSQPDRNDGFDERRIAARQGNASADRVGHQHHRTASENGRRLSKSDQYLRDYRHGGRRHYDAGDFQVREDPRRRGGQSSRAIHGHRGFGRNAAPSCRPPGFPSTPPCSKE